MVVIGKCYGVYARIPHHSNLEDHSHVSYGNTFYKSIRGGKYIYFIALQAKCFGMQYWLDVVTSFSANSALVLDIKTFSIPE